MIGANYLNTEACQSKLLLQVHDELVFDLHRDERDELPQNSQKLCNRPCQ